MIHNGVEVEIKVEVDVDIDVIIHVLTLSRIFCPYETLRNYFTCERN